MVLITFATFAVNQPHSRPYLECAPPYLEGARTAHTAIWCRCNFMVLVTFATFAVNRTHYPLYQEGARTGN